jgi:hypothetical protein
LFLLFFGAIAALAAFVAGIMRCAFMVSEGRTKSAGFAFAVLYCIPLSLIAFQV